MANITIQYYDGTSYTALYPEAYTATQLATARTIRTNLASTSTASFNGTQNITPGVNGTLGVSNGGTGVTSYQSLATQLSTYLNSGVTLKSSYYSGTGSTGKVSINFNFSPKMVLVGGGLTNQQEHYLLIWIYSLKRTLLNTYWNNNVLKYYVYRKVTLNGNTFSWETIINLDESSTALLSDACLNRSGEVYYYLGIG